MSGFLTLRNVLLIRSLASKPLRSVGILYTTPFLALVIAGCYKVALVVLSLACSHKASDSGGPDARIERTNSMTATLAVITIQGCKVQMNEAQLATTGKRLTLKPAHGQIEALTI